MELAYKEELFFSLSTSLTREEAIVETERIANNFKKIYSPKPSHLQPIIGTDTYRFERDICVEQGWDMWWESRVDKYVNGKWERFMKFKGGTTGQHVRNCIELVNRLQLGGNTIIEL
jgi:hypothetical protein